MSWVSKNGAHTFSDDVHVTRSDSDRVFKLNKVLAAYTKHPNTLMFAGVTKWGRFIYEPDGFVYKMCRKKMVKLGRWLKMERLSGGGPEIAIKSGRLDDPAELERIRWRIIERIEKSLTPEMRRRVKKVKAFSKAFRGYCGGTLYHIEVTSQGINYSWHEEEHEQVLERLAADWTPPEADKMATYLIEMVNRCARAHRALGEVEALMIKSIELRVRKMLSKDFNPDVGELVDVKLNGRIYPTWIGHRAPLRYNSNDNTITMFWPHPNKKFYEL